MGPLVRIGVNVLLAAFCAAAGAAPVQRGPIDSQAATNGVIPPKRAAELTKTIRSNFAAKAVPDISAIKDVVAALRGVDFRDAKATASAQPVLAALRKAAEAQLNPKWAQEKNAEALAAREQRLAALDAGLSPYLPAEVQSRVKIAAAGEIDQKMKEIAQSLGAFVDPGTSEEATDVWAAANGDAERQARLLPARGSELNRYGYREPSRAWRQGLIKEKTNGMRYGFRTEQEESGEGAALWFYIILGTLITTCAGLYPYSVLAGAVLGALVIFYRRGYFKEKGRRTIANAAADEAARLLGVSVNVDHIPSTSAEVEAAKKTRPSR